MQSQSHYPWSARWRALALASDIGPNHPVLIALSGGADSVFLLNLLAKAQPRPRVLAMHIEHGLRGDESREDSVFCARLCAKLGIPFARTHIELDGDGPNLEARARQARYAALAKEARAAGIATILTGHHEDDALETLLMRMMRGSDLAGLAGTKARFALAGEPKVEVVRPLLSMRREEVRQILRREGLTWREDSSNQSERFTRNRVRAGLLPDIAQAPGGMDGLRAFARAVEGLESELAERTLHLSWDPISQHSLAGGTLRRADLTALPGPLQRRALWRLLHEGTARPAGKTVLALIADDLAQGRNISRSLPGDWTLRLETERLVLLPPGNPGPGGTPLPTGTGRLTVPGEVRLPDGSVLKAERVHVPAAQAPSMDPNVAELDASGLPAELTVRLPQPGDRFHGLGAPGSKELSRFLADAGVSRQERVRLPIVCDGEEVLWVAGVRPCESRRVRAGSSERIRLTLQSAPHA
ncbi:MAG: tRNA lysidine(34) synthetase TilS [Planctomycetota bacterium]